MRGKLCAGMWVFSVVFIWLFFSFIIALMAVNMPNAEFTLEQYFMQTLPQDYTLFLALLVGSIMALYVYCQYSEAEGWKRREEKRKMQSTGETAL
jgi:hypothetical protein